MLVLLNILFAMMATTFENIAEDAKLEYIMSKADIVWTYSCKNAVLPPPMNMIVYSLWLLWFGFKAVQVSLLGGGGNKLPGEQQQSLWSRVVEGDPDYWYCQYCQHQNSMEKGSRELLELWSDKFTRD